MSRRSSSGSSYEVRQTGKKLVAPRQLARLRAARRLALAACLLSAAHLLVAAGAKRLVLVASAVVGAGQQDDADGRIVTRLTPVERAQVEFIFSGLVAVLGSSDVEQSPLVIPALAESDLGRTAVATLKQIAAAQAG